MKTKNRNILKQNTIFLWIFLGTITILLVPIIAMQFTSEVSWTIGDFILAGSLLLVTQFLFVFLVRKIRNHYHRIILGVAFILAFLYIWAELAVGIFTNWGS